MTLPLTRWQLYASALPDSLAEGPVPGGFALPGVQALDAFADLLGKEADMPAASEPDAAHISFALPAMLPPDISGPVSLRREIDFGALHGDHALLLLDHIAGSGRILLGETVLCAFDSARLTAEAIASALEMSAQPCMLAVDLTDALALGRRETLIIEFDGARPAGFPGPVTLHVAQRARVSQLRLLPDSAGRTLDIRALISAAHTGRYVLRAQAISPDGAACGVHEVSAALNAGEEKAIAFTLPLSAAAFVPGSAYAPASVRIQLFLRAQEQRSEGLLCDDALLLCGPGGKAPRFWLPVHSAQLIAEPQETVNAVRRLGVPAISLDLPAPDSVYRALCRAGISVRQFMPRDYPLRTSLIRFPNLSLTETPVPETPLSLEASAWQLCSMVSAPRTLDETLTAREMLLEAAGLELDPGDEGVADVLRWLRAVCIRLRAEAARQARLTGALCAAGEWSNPDIAKALETAFAPLHLSALPLCGAWWTTARFSASLEVFIPEGITAPLTACAVLEDDAGHVLASFSASCPARGGYLGLIEAPLPDSACVLELTCRLLEGGDVLEESALPIYVGERGPLEAAFSIHD